MPLESQAETQYKNFVQAHNDIREYLLDQYQNLPSTLHHFTPRFSDLNSILGSKQMWASHAYDMNDDMELRYASNLVQLCLAEKRKFYLSRKIWQLNEFFEMALERQNPYTNPYSELPEPFVVSLCRDGTSASQWKKYGNSGNGYCINFETEIDNFEELQRNNLVLLRKR